MYQGKDCDSDHDMEREPKQGGSKLKAMLMACYRKYKRQGLSDADAMAKAKEDCKEMLQKTA